MTSNFLIEAIHSLAPNCQFSISNFDYSTLVWSDENELPLPTKEEVIAEIERLQAEYEYKEYQRLRATEYPSFAEQFDLLYHGGYDVWKAEIDKVKEKYPKP
jgi:hypothetical protein